MGRLPAATTRRDEPVARPTEDPKPGKSDGAPVNPGDGGEDPEDLNEGRQAGESKVLWYKEAPDAPGSGADAPGLWVTGKTAVKAAYKDVYAYNVSDGKPAWDTISFPTRSARSPRRRRPTTRSSSPT